MLALYTLNFMKKIYFLLYAIIIVILAPISTYGAAISIGDYHLELPGDWKSNIEDDGVSAFIEKDAGGYYKSFALSFSDIISESEIKQSKDDFSQHFNAIESLGKNQKIIAGGLEYVSKHGVKHQYFILFGSTNNALSFYALTSINSRVMLISYKVYRATENMEFWKKEFISILDSLH